MAFYSEARFDPETSVGYLAKRVHQLAQVGLEPVFEAEGVTYTQWQALVSVHFGSGATPAALARDIAHDKGATSRLVDLLEGRGWLVRDRDASGDRRVVSLSLTPEGEAVALRCKARVVERWNGWLADWPDADLAQIIALLQRLRTTLVERAGVERAGAERAGVERAGVAA